MEEYKDKIKILALEKPLRCEDCKIDYDVEKYKRKSLKDQDEKIEGNQSCPKICCKFENLSAKSRPVNIE